MITNRSKKRIIYEKYGGRCAYCGRTLEYEDMTIDHIIPKSAGGPNTLGNLNPSCKQCNDRKGSLSIEKFEKKLGKLAFNINLYQQLCTLIDGIPVGVLIDGNYAKSSRIIARCNLPIQQGYLTKNLIKRLNCGEKECCYLEKLSNMWWLSATEVNQEETEHTINEVAL